MTQWQEYSEKFNNISVREQYLIIASGLIAIIFIFNALLLEDAFKEKANLQKNITKVIKENKASIKNIEALQVSLKTDPDVKLNKDIAVYTKKLKALDHDLSKLTSELITPIQMRQALIKLLKLQKGVSILSFQVLPVTALLSNKAKENKDKSASATESGLHLYQHGIKIILQGEYFQLRDYLNQLEKLDWKFFWQDFRYQSKEYPLSELEIIIYSLSTSEEFIGV